MLDSTVSRKFVDCIELNPDEWEIETDEGFKPITHIYKTVPYDIWQLKTDSYELKCADDHIVFTENYQQIFVKDLQVNNYIITKTGLERVISVEKLAIEPENMYDITVQSDNHRFYSNDILSHNTTTAVTFILHSILFKKNYSVAVVANKLSMATEIITRLKDSYNYLPKWMQQGVAVWNARSITLENGSKVVCDGTSAGSLRGNSFNLLLIDEFAHIPDHLLEEFFSSVYPTLSSGKTTKLIIISCVAKGTYLLTNKGYRKIDNFIDDSKTGAYFVPEYTIMGKDKFYKSDIIVNNKKSPTNIIKTRYDELECSQKHKLWAYKNGEYKFIESKYLSVGDYICVKYNHQVFGNDDYIGFNPIKGKNSNTFCCEYITPDIAYFVGLFIAEGYARDCISKLTGNLVGGQIIISCGDDISESLDKLNLRYRKADDVHYIINSGQLLDFLKLLGFDINKKAKEKIIPDKILSWSKPNICALLRGMFDGDGCIDVKGRVKYTSASRELIRQVQLLLSNLGVLGALYTSITPPTKKVKVSSIGHNLEMSGNNAVKYFECVGFGLKRKQERINLTKKSTRIGHVNDIIPNSLNVINESGFKVKRAKPKGQNYSRDFLLSIKEDLINHSPELKEFVQNNVDENLIWLPIKDIQNGETEVYDVSLPDIEGDNWCHSVLYNNFVGHQTPRGQNLFYKLWMGAKTGQNQYVPTMVHWTQIPGRDEEWRKIQISNTSEKQFQQEFESVSYSSQLIIAPDKYNNYPKNFINNDIINISIGDLYNELNTNRKK